MEHQKAVTIRNDVNVKKETLRIEPDEENPDKYLVAFSFDATVAGRYIGFSVSFINEFNFISEFSLLSDNAMPLWFLFS